MTTTEEQAVAFKNEGNKAFASHDWVTAIDCYTKAIELNSKEPTYYSNRAQVFYYCLELLYARVTDLAFEGKHQV